MDVAHADTKPAELLLEHVGVIRACCSRLPALDLACGSGRNGTYLAREGLKAVLADISRENLVRARQSAGEALPRVLTCRVDMEKDGLGVFRPGSFGAVLVFRYLHRPLMPFIRELLCPGGVLLYETFTVDQPRFGKPCNPDFLLKPGELVSWFEDWDIIHRFEGILEHPKQAVANIVCRRPG